MGGSSNFTILEESLVKTTQSASSSPQPEATTQRLLSTSDSSCPERHRVRHILYGSSRAIEHTIRQLHLLRYVDQFRWNPVADIPESGLLITPAQAESYAFLLKELLLD